jgi:hypothetical protein
VQTVAACDTGPQCNYGWNDAQWEQNFAQTLEAKIKILNGSIEELQAEITTQEASEMLHLGRSVSPTDNIPIDAHFYKPRE